VFEKMNKVIEYLEQVGLSEIEAKLYLTLLQDGATSVRNLARATGIQRTSTYDYLNQLVDKGLVYRVVKGTKKQVSANPPEECLLPLVEERAQTAKTLQNTFSEVLHLFPQRSETGEAEIKYYKGKLGVKRIYEEALKAKELRSYVNIASMVDTLPENSILFAEALKNNKDIKIFEIIENSLLSQEQTQFQTNNADHKRYFYKFLPKEVKLSAADTLIYDGKVAIINVRGQITGVVLHNTDYYKNCKELFDFNWNVLPPANQ